MASTLLAHWWAFFFVPTEAHTPWYHGQVWGNVVAVLPLAVLGIAGFVYHHSVLVRLHKAHDAHLRAIMAALDPESDTGTRLDQIADAVDEGTPGGLKTVLDAIASKQ